MRVSRFFLGLAPSGRASARPRTPRGPCRRRQSRQLARRAASNAARGCPRRRRALFEPPRGRSGPRRHRCGRKRLPHIEIRLPPHKGCPTPAAAPRSHGLLRHAELREVGFAGLLVGRRAPEAQIARSQRAPAARSGDGARRRTACRCPTARAPASSKMSRMRASTGDRPFETQLAWQNSAREGLCANRATLTSRGLRVIS